MHYYGLNLAIFPYFRKNIINTNLNTMEIFQNTPGSAMLPFVMRELVELVMKKKMLLLEDALYLCLIHI